MKTVSGRSKEQKERKIKEDRKCSSSGSRRRRRKKRKQEVACINPHGAAGAQ